MDELNAVKQPEPGNIPADPVQEPLNPDQKKLLIKAQCAEKEGHYLAARDHFTELGKSEDALRCSEMIRLDNWREENRPHIINLAVSSGIIILVFLVSLIWLNNLQRSIKSPSVVWLNAGKVELSSYPTWFLYDRNNHLLKTSAVIDEKMKIELVKTYPLRSDSTHFGEFRQAVEQLSFQSSNIKGSSYWLLLLVSGFAAVVGVLIREILDLIRHYCYDRDLDFKAWWPWYVLRPFVGFMMGIMVILFNGTDLLFSSSGNNSETYLVAIAIIAGISVEDVMFKIRKVSQLLFGNNYEDKSGKGTTENTAPAKPQTTIVNNPENKKDKS